MAFRKKTFIFAGIYAFFAMWQVWAHVDVTMKDSVEVTQGGRAEFPCRFVITGEPSVVIVQWIVVTKKSGSRQQIYYSDGSAPTMDSGTDFEGRISVKRSRTSEATSGSGHSEDVLLVVEDVRLDDQGEYICQVNGVSAGSKEGSTLLMVFVAPETVVIQGETSINSVTDELPSKIAECEARNSYPKPTIVWYRDRTPLQDDEDMVIIRHRETQESSGLFTVQSDLQLKVVKEDKDAFFYCEVNYLVPGGTQNMKESQRINITVHYPPTAVSLLQIAPDGLVKEGDTVEIQCHSDGYPPPHITFRREGKEDELTSHQGLLVLNDVTREDSGAYQCQSLDYASFEEARGEIDLEVHHLDHAVTYPREMVVEQGEDKTASCNAQSSLPTHTLWYKDGAQVGEGHMLNILNATFDSAGEYVCEISVPSLPGLQVKGSTIIKVQGAPEIRNPEDTVMEEMEKKSVNLSCEAWGYPKPIITWIRTGGQNWQELSNKETPHGAQSLVTFTVTSDLTAACNATNDIGTDTKLFSIKAIPLTTSGAVTKSPYPEKVKKEGSGVIIAVIIICILLLAILGSVLYFLYKKGKFPCGRSGKQNISSEKSSKDDIIMEMKSEKSEEAVLLQGINGEKRGINDQGEHYMDVQK